MVMLTFQLLLLLLLQEYPLNFGKTLAAVGAVVDPLVVLALQLLLLLLQLCRLRLVMVGALEVGLGDLCE